MPRANAGAPPSPAIPPMHGRRRGPGMLALGVSLGLHGAALAGFVLLRNVTPPEPYAVMSVELVEDTGGNDGSRVGEEPAGPTRFSTRSPMSETAADRREAAVSSPPEAAPPVPPEPPPRAENAVAADDSATDDTAEAMLRAPPMPGRKPRPPEPATDAETARRRFEERLAEFKGAPLRPADPAPTRASAQFVAERTTAQTGQTATPALERQRGAAAMPAGGRTGGPNGGIGGNIEKSAATSPGYSGGSLSNAPPRYPYLARRQGQEGRVVLRVRVSAGGDPMSVRVRQSSGYRRLDDAAVKAVGTWRFTPARRGGIPVAGSVDVPISFRLTDR